MSNNSDNYQLTQNTYNQISDQRAREVAAMDEELKSLLDEFISLLPKDAHILDLGCGSGRDSKYLSEKKLNVTGIDFSQNLLNIAKKTAPKACFYLKDILKDELGKENFNGILANASLLHLSELDLHKALKKIHLSLKKDGIIFARFKSGHGEHLINKIINKTKYPLFFSYYSKKNLKEIFESENFKILKISTTKNIRGWWINLFAQKYE